MEQQANIPLWVEKVGRSGGRDHLALESVGQAMIEELTSGISNITQRARYLSFFSWVIKLFFESDEVKDRSSFKKYLHKMALLYAVSNSAQHLDDSLSGIDGIDFARNNLDSLLIKEKPIEEFLENYNDNYWIYKAKLEDLDLTYTNDETGIPALVEPEGKKLASAFEHNISDLKERIKKYPLHDREFLKKLESKWCYHHLKDNSEERQILEDVLFARNNDLPKNVNRRYSLILFLSYIEQFEDKEIHGFERWLFSDPQLPQNLEKIKENWKVFFSRNHLVFAIESLFHYFLQSVNENNLDTLEFVEKMEKDFTNEDNFSQLLYTPVEQLLQPDHWDNIQIDKYEPDLIIPLDEISLSKKREDYHQFFRNSVITLLSIYHRYKGEEMENNLSKIFMDLGGSFRISLSVFIEILNDSAVRNEKLIDFLRRFYFEQIIPRHLLISTEKMYSRNLDTFHFNKGDRYFEYLPIADSFQPKYNMMKTNEIYNFLMDLDLIQEQEDKYLLTERGRQVKEEFYE